MKLKTLALSTSLLVMSSVFEAKADPISYSQATGQTFEPHPEPEPEPVSNSSAITCPKSDGSAPRRKVNLRTYKVNLIHNIDQKYLNQFLFEISKFPANLNREMIARGSEINLLQGSGVTADSSWIPTNQATFDGRPWSEVPGSGGHTILHADKVPTRIVANHLYDNHGSVNLVLHERAHTLDYLYLSSGVSGSKVWKDLMASNPGIENFINEICTEGYCNKEDEAFAELFAYNYACPATQKDLKEKFPKVSNFFKNLSSIERIHLAEATLAKRARVLERERKEHVRKYNAYQKHLENKAKEEVQLLGN